MPTLEAVQTTSGPPARVWELLADARQWSRWGRWSRVEIEGGGEQEPGAVRLLVAWPFRVRERVTEVVPGRRMAYELVDGLRVRGYHAEVDLEERPGGGAVVRWRSHYERAGPFTALLLRFALRDTCRRLARAAAR